MSWRRVRVRASSGRGTSTFLRSFLFLRKGFWSEGFTGLGWCYVGSWGTKARDARASRRYWGQLIIFSSACGEVFISASESDLETTLFQQTNVFSLKGRSSLLHCGVLIIIHPILYCGLLCDLPPVWPSSCVTPAGTSNKLDVQNEWEENTHKTPTSFAATRWTLNLRNPYSPSQGNTI